MVRSKDGHLVTQDDADAAVRPFRPFFLPQALQSFMCLWDCPLLSSCMCTRGCVCLLACVCTHVCAPGPMCVTCVARDCLYVFVAVCPRPHKRMSSQMIP